MKFTPSTHNLYQSSRLPTLLHSGSPHLFFTPHPHKRGGVSSQPKSGEVRMELPQLAQTDHGSYQSQIPDLAFQI